MVRNFTFALLMSLVSSQALANDTTAELKTGGLEFTHSDDVVMQEEKLYISPTRVKVDYVYHNSSDKDVETYVAFPMPDIQGSLDPIMDAGDRESDNFLGFTVTQDGVAIKPSLQQRAYSGNIDMTDVLKAAKIPLNPLSDATSKALAALPEAVRADLLTRGLVYGNTYDDGSGEKTDWTAMWNLKSSYYWKTTFPAGKDVRVHHEYNPSVGGTVALTYLDQDDQPKGEIWDEYVKKYCVDQTFVKIAQKYNKNMRDQVKPYYVENWISYVLSTGANWMGPIGKFTLIVDKGVKDNYVSFCGTGVKKTGETTFTMTASDFTPEKDLDILLLVPATW